MVITKDKKLVDVDTLSKVQLLVSKEGEDFYDVQSRVCSKIMGGMMDSDEWGTEFDCSYDQDRTYQFQWVWRSSGITRFAAFVLAKDVGKFIGESNKLASEEEFGFDPLTDNGFEYFAEVFVFSPDGIRIPDLDKLVSKKADVILMTTKKKY